jgi:hypothetical protein
VKAGVADETATIYALQDNGTGVTRFGDVERETMRIVRRLADALGDTDPDAFAALAAAGRR